MQNLQEIRDRVLNSINDLIQGAGDYRRLCEKLSQENAELTERVSDLIFEKQCLADRIAELEAQVHEERCDEIARSL